ncbi:MAG: lamin tail domain-containing protein, partial [Psychroserpens sp.]|nr:lamin tail domain-containing protein [Psychroserpens sp.]
MKKNYIFSVIAICFVVFCSFGQMTDLIISEYGEGSSNNKYIEIYNGTGSAVDLSNYRIWRIANGGSWPEASYQLSGILANGDTYIVANASAGATISAAADAFNSFTISWNGNDAAGLAKDIAGTYTLIDAVGTDGANPGSGWDVAGFGDPTLATWTSLSYNPNNTSTGFGASADDTTVVDASGITGVAYLAFFYDAAAGSGPEEWNITEVEVITGAPDTEVNFIGSSANVAEDSGTYDLEFSIVNEDATNATTFDVVLTSGDAADINSYTTQGVTFPAGSFADQTVTITITDDMIEEMDETLTFEIQNVAGGQNAAVGTSSTFDLTILANDEPVLPGTLYDADFTNDGDGFPAHTSGSPPAAGPTSVGPFGTAPNQWLLSYDTAPGSDTTANTFEVSGGELTTRDWGGQGIFTSQVIDVTGISVVDITATGINVGANTSGSEYFRYFYILDGGSRVETDVDSSNGQPVNYSVLSLDVSGATSLEVGFEFFENGSGDGYDIANFMVVEGSADT